MTIARVNPSYPVLVTDFQLSLQGLLMGTGTPYKLLQLDGLGLPPVRSSDAERAGAHGSFGGQDFSDVRDLVLRLGVGPRQGMGDPTVHQLVANLIYARSPVTDDVALALKVPGSGAGLGPLVFVGRPRRCEAPYDVLAAKSTGGGGYVEALALFRALDPIKYAAVLQDVLIGYGSAGTNAGFTFNRATPASTPGLAFNRATPAATPGAASDAAAGGAGAAGFQQLTNNGNQATLPVSRIKALSGPVTGPLHLERVESGEVITINYSMAANDVLELDHDLRSVMLNGAANRADLADLSSAWWALRPGVNTIHYRTDGPGAGSTAEVLWRDASW